MVGLTLGVAAQDTTDPTTVSGVWQMSVQADHVIAIGMELKQDGKIVTGIIPMPTHNGRRKEVSLKGEFADGALILTGTAEGRQRRHRQNRNRGEDAERWRHERHAVGRQAQRAVDWRAARPMTNRTFLVVAVVVAVLVLAMLYMHRPRSSSATRSVAPHGTR
jgi:hypothetical protein